MTPDDLRGLYEYNRWANDRTIQAVLALTAEQCTRELGGGHHSVHGTLLHSVAGECGWFEYWKEPPSGDAALSAFWDRCNARFEAPEFAAVSAIRAEWIALDRERTAFVQRLTSEDLERALPLGAESARLADLILHQVTHSAYHRGQIALMLRQLGVAPPATDFDILLSTPTS